MAKQSRASRAAAVGRLALAALFVAIPRRFFELEIAGLERDEPAPSTFLAITHKRDPDAFLPLPYVLGHRGWHALIRDVHFAMRSDSFERGFLARIVLRPRWLSWLLRPIAVGPVLRAVGVHPLYDLHMRPGETWLRDLLAGGDDPPVAEAMAPAVIATLAAAARLSPDRVAALRLSDLLAWRFHEPLQAYYGPNLFIGRARRRAQRRAADQARVALDGIAAWLRAGGSLYNAPEGRLSPDGRLSPITAGFHRVIRAGAPETRVVPIAVVYDFMTIGRARVFVDVAPPILEAPALAARDLDARLRAAWLGAARFTCTQLASGFLVDAAALPKPASFTTDDLAVALQERARALAAAGRNVDVRLLDPRRARTLAGRYLRFAARRGYVRRLGRGTWRLEPLDLSLRVGLGEPGYGATPLAYAHNELDEMLHGARPAAQPVPLTSNRREHLES